MQKSRAQAITVFLTTNRFKGLGRFYANSKVYRFSVPTSDTRTIIAKAIESLGCIYKPGYEYNKTGILLMGLVGEDYKQINLFDSTDHNKSDQLMKVIDAINSKQGKGAVFFGAQGIQKGWSMKRNIMSPKYTTHWDELPKAI